MQNNLALKIAPTPVADTREIKIDIQSIEKTFTKDGKTLKVIDGINLSVRKGEFVSIVGPSGCGKTTLMNIIAGFDQPTKGSILVDGTVREKANPNGIVISQQGSVFPWLSVQQNILFGLNKGTSEEKRVLAQKYIDLVGLTGFEKSYPHELSGGMLKRVEIARALVMKPDILFMDEPFSALDALMNLKIRNELLKILEQEKHTVILITHDIEEAVHLSDRIVVLSQRPSLIKATFDLSFAHPRKTSSSQIQAIKEAVLKELGM